MVYLHVHIVQVTCTSAVHVAHTLYGSHCLLSCSHCLCLLHLTTNAIMCAYSEFGSRDHSLVVYKHYACTLQ